MKGISFRKLLVVLFVICCSVPAAGYGASADDAHAWSKEETAILRSLWIGTLPPPPKDPSNAYSGNPRAARLGERLFFDKRFSRNGLVSCGTCHEADYNFTEQMPRATGIGPTVRRTQPVIGMAYLSSFFWDGRADSLWAQALGPPENPNEHGISRTLCAQIIGEHYRMEYEEIFGPLPDFPKDKCLPAARPDPDDKAAYEAWNSMPPGKAEEITRVYVNMGKAIAAYERLILPGPSRFDSYVEALLKGDRKEMERLLDKKAAEGLRLFIGRANCIGCHSGPLFTNGKFKKTGVYQPAELPPDSGRQDGIKKVLSDEFNCLGRYSDAGRDNCATHGLNDTDASRYAGAFKVPTLRNVAERAPYMHAGQYWALWEVVRFYNIKSSGALEPELRHAGLSNAEQDSLVAFLESLSGPLVVPDFGSGKDHGAHRHN